MIQNDEQFIESWLRWGGRPVRDQVQGLVAGDSKELVALPEIPALRDSVSRTITKAWLTIKSLETAADPTENAVWTAAGGMQSITTTAVAGRGVILNASEGSPELRFDILASNTAFLTPHKTYHLGIQLKMDDNALYEVERSTFNTGQQLVVATT